MLDIADTAEAGADVPSRGLNGHVAEGYVVAYMPLSTEQMMSFLVLRVVTEAQR